MDFEGRCPKPEFGLRNLHNFLTTRECNIFQLKRGVRSQESVSCSGMKALDWISAIMKSGNVAEGVKVGFGWLELRGFQFLLRQ